MTTPHNPIVRTFGRLRAVLVSTLGVDRHRVRPAVPLDLLIPPDRFGDVLARLRESGLPAPELEWRTRHQPLWFLGLVALVLCFLLSVLAPWWLACAAGVPLFVTLVALACTVTRPRVVHLPLGPRTVGELVIALTRFSDHPGYRFSRAEISLKVRLIVADHLGLPLDRVTEESSFGDMGSW